MSDKACDSCNGPLARDYPASNGKKYPLEVNISFSQQMEKTKVETYYRVCPVCFTSKVDPFLYKIGANPHEKWQ